MSIVMEIIHLCHKVVRGSSRQDQKPRQPMRVWEQSLSYRESFSSPCVLWASLARNWGEEESSLAGDGADIPLTVDLVLVLSPRSAYHPHHTSFTASAHAFLASGCISNPYHFPDREELVTIGDVWCPTEGRY